MLVNEIFGPTIQGEGKSAGKEVMFLRLSGCNLSCIWCDTPYTWNWIGTKFKHPEKYNPQDESHKMTPEEVVARLEKSDVKALVISGGEPLLQQKELCSLIKGLRKSEKIWWIEIETNGTIAPSRELLALVDQINCSPKLYNSGNDNSVAERIVPEALVVLTASEKVNFKFVVQNVTDLYEVRMFQVNYELPKESIYLMPEGRTKDEQLKKQDEIATIAQTYGYQFSPRLHVLKWDTKRKV